MTVNECYAFNNEDNKHLTLDQRVTIEQGIRNGATKTAIAKTIGKDNSTVGKEIKEHRFIKIPCSLPLECDAYRKCVHGRQCTMDCPDYVPFVCKRRDRSPGACNGCSNYTHCRFAKIIYSAEIANKEYHETLVNYRQGVNMTTDEAKQYGAIIAPLLKQGLSPYQILKAHPELPFCEKTFYNYVENGVFCIVGLGPMDLRKQVSRKLPKAKATVYKKREDSRYLNGRKYEDFLSFLAENPDVNIVEMDTVYNDITNGPFLQTFKFRLPCPFFIALFHEHKTNDDMISGIDLLEEIMGKELFEELVKVILTDRGSEFTAADRAEIRPDGTRRTRIFYCDPMQSGQKGSLENKHNQLRYILPKECDLRKLGLINQEALNLVVSHLNSALFESVGGKSPFECLNFFYPELYQKMLLAGIHPVPFDQICLTPDLLKPFRSSK